MIKIRIYCENCVWDRIAKSEPDSAISIDEIIRNAQTHCNKEDHKVVIKGKITPNDK